MKFRVLIVILATLLSSAHADNDEEIHSSNLPALELTPQIFYQILLAEIAGSRGQIGLAADVYSDLAVSTRDPRIARRAAEAALIVGRHEQALADARLWSEIEPDSSQAKQMVAGLLASMNRADDLAVFLGQQLAKSDNVGPQLMQLNRALLRFPDKQAMLRLVDKLTEPYPKLPEAHFARAQAAHAAGDKDLARTEIERALELRPDWEYAALVRAQLMPTPAERSKALAEFVAANPKARDARLAYARSLVGEHRLDDARREFRTLLEANPDNTDMVYAVAVLSIQLKDYDDAETQLKRLLDLGYSEADSARLYLGQIAEERKRWDEALKWYDEIGAGGQYLSARMHMAKVLQQQGKLAQARAVLHDSTAGSDEDRNQLLIAEAQLLRESGDDQGAYDVLAGGLALRPDQPELLYETALSADKIGKMDIAERDLRRLIELKPDYAHAYNALGYSLADRNMRLDEAEALIDKALQLAPEDPFILDSKGWVLFRRGDANGALEVLRKAFALRADPEIAAHLGEVLWALGRQDEARKTWDDAAKANPDNQALAATIKKFGKP